MRHRKKFNHLSRKSAHRKAMFANMASSLLLHKRIKTTQAKAKALRMYIEPLITKAKHSLTTKTKQEEATHLRRIVFSYLKQKEAVTELFREVAPKILDRPGGYTRILKLGKRLGDNAELCYIELVDFNENLLKAASKKQETAATKKPTRRRRSRSKSDKTKAASPVTKKKTEPKKEIKSETKSPTTKDTKGKTEKSDTAKKSTTSKVKAKPKATTPKKPTTKKPTTTKSKTTTAKTTEKKKAEPTKKAVSKSKPKASTKEADKK